MEKPVLVDTDVMIDYLRGHSEAVTLIKDRASRMLLSTIVVAELYAGAKGEEERSSLDSLVSIFRLAPVTLEIARLGGLLKRDFSKSHGVGLADAILAATAHAENAELLTLNVKHYPMFRGLRPAYVKR